MKILIMLFAMFLLFGCCVTTESGWEKTDTEAESSDGSQMNQSDGFSEESQPEKDGSKGELESG